jgi:hypothetical protein
MSKVVTSSFSQHRMMFPERVFGKAGVKWMSSGLAMAPITWPTWSRSSFSRPAKIMKETTVSNIGLKIKTDRIKKLSGIDILKSKSDIPNARASLRSECHLGKHLAAFIPAAIFRFSR